LVDKPDLKTVKHLTNSVQVSAGKLVGLSGSEGMHILLAFHRVKKEDFIAH
jgi:hypothetical protein